MRFKMKRKMKSILTFWSNDQNLQINFLLLLEYTHVKIDMKLWKMSDAE